MLSNQIRGGHRYKSTVCIPIVPQLEQAVVLVAEVRWDRLRAQIRE